MIEGLMLRGLRTSRIHDLLCEDYPDLGEVTYGTLRNDIVEINKAHRGRMEDATELKGRDQFLARSLLARDMAIDKGDVGTLHKINKDIAGLSGVTLSINDRKLTLNLEQARGYLESIFKVVFTYVTEEKTRKLIMQDVEMIEADLE